MAKNKEERYVAGGVGRSPFRGGGIRRAACVFILAGPVSTAGWRAVCTSPTRVNFSFQLLVLILRP